MGVPYLHELVPATGNNDGVLGVRRETDARRPLGVALLGDGVLAVTEGVPELDAAVTGSGDDLTVVGGEGDGENVVGVADEAAGGGTGGELPEAERLVPGRGEGVGTVGGDDLFSNCQLRRRDFPAGQLLSYVGDIRSRRRCVSGREDCAWGSRRRSRRG